MPFVVVHNDVVPFEGSLATAYSTRPYVLGVFAVRCAEVNSEKCVLSHRAAVLLNLEAELQACLLHVCTFQIKIRVEVEDTVVSPCGIAGELPLEEFCVAFFHFCHSLGRYALIESV